MPADRRPARRPRRSGFRRAIRVLFLLALVGAAGGGWFWHTRSAEAVTRPATVAVTRGTIEETVLASGMLEANRLVSVGAQVSGIVETLEVGVGDVVRAGDLVATIDRLDQENALRSAQAQLAQLQAQLQAQEATLRQAQSAHARALDMKDRGIITDVDLENAGLTVALAEAQLAQIGAQVEQARVSIQTAELDLSRTRITAPISGTVVSVNVSVGQTLSAQSSAPTVMKIADLDTMVIKAEISEADVTRVEAGQKVWFTVLGDPGTRIEAVLTSVAPAPAAIADTDEIPSDQAVYYYGLFEVPNPDHRLRIAMTAEVTIVLDEARDVLVIPVAALRRQGGQSVVQVWDEATGNVRSVPVRTGLDDDIRVEIVEGLSEGDQIVASGAFAAIPSGAGQGSRPGGGPPGLALRGF